MSRISPSSPSTISCNTWAISAVSVSPRSAARARMLCVKCLAVWNDMSAPLGNGCVEAPILPREVAGTLFHRAPRAKRLAGRCTPRAGIVTADALPRITSSPSRQNISIVDVVSRRVFAPVSGSVLVEMLVLALVWKALEVKLFMADSVVDLSMTESSFFCPFLSLRTVTKDSQRFGKGG